jgi:hypothetical protein
MIGPGGLQSQKSQKLNDEKKEASHPEDEK